MKIKWQIKKKRGNFRPTLNYTIVLEDYEKELAIHAVRIDTGIPEIPNPHLSHCQPGQDERSSGWRPTGFHRIQVPYFKTGRASDFIRLPFRASGEYPEVEAAFRDLRRIYEEEVCRAYGQAPIDQSGALGVSPETGRQIAARVTADRMLSLFAGPENRRPGRDPFQDRMAG